MTMAVRRTPKRGETLMIVRIERLYRVEITKKRLTIVKIHQGSLGQWLVV